MFEIKTVLSVVTKSSPSGPIWELVEPGSLSQYECERSDWVIHIELAAPQDGTIHEPAVHTIGGVVAPGEVLMLIVPSGDLEIETQISTTDVDQLHIGAQALLRLTAFNQRTTPELLGRLSRISADIAFDQKMGVSFYRARITIEASELAKLRGLSWCPECRLKSSSKPKIGRCFRFC